MTSLYIFACSTNTTLSFLNFLEMAPTPNPPFCIAVLSPPGLSLGVLWLGYQAVHTTTGSLYTALSPHVFSSYHFS